MGGADRRCTQRRRGAELEQAICGAALAELLEAGYPDFTIDAVAARARTGKASIYRRWPGKGELLIEAISRAMPVPVGTDLAEQLPDSVSTRDALVMMFDQMVGELDPSTVAPLRCVIAAVAQDESLAQVLRGSVIAPREQGLRRLLDRGVQRGEVRSDAPLDMLVDIIPGFIVKRLLLRICPVLDEAASRRFVDEVIMPLVADREAAP